MPDFTYQTEIFSDTDHIVCKYNFDNFVTDAMKTPGVEFEIVTSNMYFAPDPNNDNIPTFYIYLLYKEIRIVQVRFSN